MAASTTRPAALRARSRAARQEAQSADAGKEEVRAAAHCRKRRQAGQLPAHRPFGHRQVECAVLRADDRVTLVPELVKTRVVRPHVLRELELTHQACAPDECGNAAFDTVLAHAL